MSIFANLRGKKSSFGKIQAPKMQTFSILAYLKNELVLQLFFYSMIVQSHPDQISKFWPFVMNLIHANLVTRTPKHEVGYQEKTNPIH